MAIRKSVVKGQIQNLNEILRAARFPGQNFQHPSEDADELLHQLFNEEIDEATKEFRQFTLIEPLNWVIKHLEEELER